MLSAVLLFGCMPCFQYESKADYGVCLNIYTSPLVRDRKVGDIEFYGGGNFNQYYEDITEVQWYKIVEGTPTLVENTYELESGVDYIVSMKWNMDQITINNERFGFSLHDAYTDYTYCDCAYLESGDLIEATKNNKMGYYTDYSPENTRDKKVTFYLDWTNDKDIILPSETLNLHLYSSFDKTFDEQNLRQASWNELWTEGADLDKITIGPMSESALNEGYIRSYGTYDDNIINAGEYWDFGLVFETDKNVRALSVDGRYLELDYEHINNFSTLQTYVFDDDNDEVMIFVKDGIANNEIDSVQICEPYVNDTAIHVKASDSDVTYNENVFYNAYVYEGAFTNADLSTKDLSACRLEAMTDTDVFHEYIVDAATNTHDFWVIIPLNNLLDKDYTLVLEELEGAYSTSGKLANTYVTTFHPAAKNVYDISVRDMKLGQNVFEWLYETMYEMKACMRFRTSVNWMSMDILSFDEINDVLSDPTMVFSENQKLNITFCFTTRTLPTEVNLVKGNSDYKPITLTKGNLEEYFDYDKTIDSADPSEYAELAAKYQGIENKWDYRIISQDGFQEYKILCKATLDFSPEAASHTTKKYTAKNVNTSAEKIKGSSSKGSTRTVVPKEGKKVSSVVVTDTKGNAIPVTLNEDGTYSFTQPASSVNVEVVYKNREIKLTIGSTDAFVDEELNSLDVCPVIRNDRTMLPIRFVAENLGAKVEWSEKNPNYVLITKGDIKIEITLGSDVMKVNGKDVKLDSVAFAENDRTYLPVRAVSENLNAIVEWNEARPMEVKIYER